MIWINSAKQMLGNNYKKN